MAAAQRRISRRQLAGLGAGAALAGALGPWAGADSAAAQEPSSGDELTLATALGLELTLQTIYSTAARSGRLGGHNQTLIERFEADARIHARALGEAAGPGATLPERRSAAEVPGLARIDAGRRFLRLALGFEMQAYVGYLDAIGSLVSRSAIELVAQIGASCAQHLALLRAQLGIDPTPSAFETGGRA